MDLADVGVIEGRDGTHLLLKASHVPGGQPLDRDHPVHAAIARFINFTHAAGTDERDNLVRAELFSRVQGHGDRFYRSHNCQGNGSRPARTNGKILSV